MATATIGPNEQLAERRRAASIKRDGDSFTHLNEAVIEYQRRGLSRALAIRQAAIDYPALHSQWIEDKRNSHGQELTKAKHRVGFK